MQSEHAIPAEPLTNKSGFRKKKKTHLEFWLQDVLAGNL